MEDYTHGTIRDIDLVHEMETSFLEYSMSVITSRALPDVRDGLKPVHRRILYSMNRIGLHADKPFKKSAHIVGDVLANYHPHGDSAVYNAMVRLAQTFSMRYPLVDGQGNFGNIDGYQAAHQRYTEARMTKLAHEMLRDIDKETVDFSPTYDESSEEPTVLPARYPNLLVNGSSGIAVGMATNIPPHNLRDTIGATVALIDNPEIEDDELIRIIKGPDFPTAATIIGVQGIRDAYKTGRGSILVRAKSNIEKMSNGKHRIVVTELPYQVNKARMVERIAELTRDKVLDGITALRDESDRDGLRVVMELRRDVNPNIMLNLLYKHTAMQQNFSVNMLALVNGVPRILTLREMLSYYLDHQENVIIRRTEYELRKAEARAHIVEGLKIAVDHIDEVISIIRSSYDDQESKSRLGERFGMTDIQAQAVIEMQLRRLQGLNREKLEAELKDLMAKIKEYKEILADIEKVRAIVRSEMLEIMEKFGDERRTDIVYSEDDLEKEDLIAEEDVVITISHSNYIKRMPMDSYKSQRRGGRGVNATKMKDNDFIEQIFITTTHNYLLFFTDKGRVLRLKAYDVPEGSRTARGIAMVNLIEIEPGENITTVLALKDYEEDKYLVCATANGKVKKTSLSEYDSNRKAGLLGIKLDDDDALIDVRITDGKDEIILVTEKGMSIRFSEDDVRPTGRVTSGVTGIRLKNDDQVISMDILSSGSDLLVITENGSGKRTSLEDYNTQNRAGSGVMTIRLSKKNGYLASARVVRDGEDVMIISKEGTLIRMATNDISRFGRATQGVNIMRLDKGDKVIAMAKIMDDIDV